MMIGNQNSHEMVARRAKESHSNSQVRRGEPRAGTAANANRSKAHDVNGYNFYGDHSGQDSLIKRECAEPKSKKTKVVEVIDFGEQDTYQSRENQHFSMSEVTDKERAPGQVGSRGGPHINRNDSESMLKKLIENIRTSHALRNDSIREQFKLSEI